MAAIDKEKKSSRLLASRRYTHDTYTDSQEAFTKTVDLSAEEIYTQASYVPSSGLPFSGSSQNLESFMVSGSNVLKYWYRWRLTKSNTNNEVWFFLNPTGSSDGIGAQLISTVQEVNFISPKYSIPSLGNAVTEDTTPGYGVVLYKATTTDSSSLDSGDKISVNDVVKFETQIHDEISSKHPELLEAINNEKDLSTENDQKLKTFLDNLLKKFLNN